MRGPLLGVLAFDPELSRGRRGMVGPIRGVARVLAGSQARVTEQFAHDSGIAHRPAVAWLEVRRIVAVFDVAPPDSLGVTSRAVDQVGDKDIRETEPVAPGDFPVARQSKDPSGATAAPVVVPEAGLDPAR